VWNYDENTTLSGTWWQESTNEEGTWWAESSDPYTFIVNIPEEDEPEEDETDVYVQTTEGEDCGYFEILGYWVDCAEGLTCEQQENASTSGSYHICVASEEDEEETTC
jgi:hypothetical protein